VIYFFIPKITLIFAVTKNKEIMIELKTLYIIETKDKITKISFGYRMPLGVNPGAIRFTNDIENAAMFKSKEDAEKEIERISKKYPTSISYLYEVTRNAYKLL
jgi:hypothetical protein